MSALVIDRSSLEQLAALLLERAGLKITPDGYYGLRLALQARLPALELTDAAEYVKKLRSLAGEAELRSLLPLVTVGKTEFFRDTRQFNAFEAEVLPGVLAEARRAGRVVKMWSAGCATGEEPYSISMAAIERGALPGEVDIRATDLNPVAVESAKLGRFPARRLIGVSEERLARFFVRDEDVYEVMPPVRESIRFESHNLAAPIWTGVERESIDVIFCRNVIIYFDLPTIVGVMQRFHDALRPGGWLLLGYSESLFKVATRFDMVEVGGVFAYRRAPDGSIRPLRTLDDLVSRMSRPPSPSAPTRPLPPVVLPPPPRPSQPPARSVSSTSLPAVASGPANTPNASFTSLVAVGAAPSPRPSASKTPATLPPLPPPNASAPRPSANTPPKLYAEPLHRTPVERLADVIRAIEAGDFPKALRLSTRLAGDEPDDLAARLTLGNVHALMGNVEEAREAYGEALQREPLCVEARVYLALAAMQGDDLVQAKQELTRALFLEPTLSLGHYLLGQVLERKADPEGARRSYRNAITHRKAPPHPMVGHFPDLPRSNDGIAQAAQYRLAALSEG